jgi:hypothetical protein
VLRQRPVPLAFHARTASSAGLPPSLKLRRTAEALAEAGQASLIRPT